MSIIITPTISLMQDQVTNALSQGINAAYLGSAQIDKIVEHQSLNPDGKFD